ncbi:Putative LOC100748578, partial [Caligus rogercresseyi]
TQPDGDLKSDGFGKEACMALLDNKYSDGLRWHDEPCNTRRVLICEDLPAPNINFVRNQNPGITSPKV